MALTVRISQAMTVVVCGAGLLCACGLGGGYKPPAPPPDIPETSISATDLYFRASAGTASPVQQVTLTNHGNEPLGIAQQEMSDFRGGTFSMATTCGHVLASSASCVMSVTFHPDAKLKQGHYGGIIKIYMADNEEHRVYLTGTVEGPKVPTPPAPK